MPPAQDHTAPARFPILQGVLPTITARIPAEILAGIALAAIAVPEVMARARSKEGCSRTVTNWYPAKGGTVKVSTSLSRLRLSRRSEDVDMVTVPGIEGQLGLLPHHVRLMTQLVPGEMIVRKNGQVRFLAVGEGLIEVTSDRVSIVTDMAVAAENIDEAKAEEARQHATARLREKISSAEVAFVTPLLLAH